MSELTLEQKQLFERINRGELAVTVLPAEEVLAYAQYAQSQIIKNSQELIKTNQDKQNEVKRHQKQEQHNLKIISNLRAKVTKETTRAQTAETLVEELKVAKENYKTIIANFFEQLRLLSFVSIKICNDDVIPDIRTAQRLELEEYLQQVVATLSTAVSCQSKYIDNHILKQTSEKNPRRTPNVDLDKYINDDGSINTDTKNAIEYGKEQEAHEAIAVASIPGEFDEDEYKDISVTADNSASKLTGNERVTEYFTDKLNSKNSNDETHTLSSITPLVTQYLNEALGNTPGNETVVLNDDANLKANRPLIAKKAVSHRNHDDYITMFCPHCMKHHELKIVRKIARVNELLINDNGRINKAMLSVGTAKCELTGGEVELHPVATDSYNLFEILDDKEQKTLSDSVSKRLSDTLSDSELTTNEKRNAKRNQSKQDYRQLIAAPSAVQRVVDYGAHTIVDGNGNEVIEPNYVVTHDGAELPLFLKSSFSVGLTIDMATWFSYLSATKSRIIKFLDDCGFTLSKAQAIGNLNGFSRAFLYPMSNKIHVDMLKHNHTVLMDETTLKVRENTRLTGQNTSYIWNMTSAFTEDFKATWFMVSPDRKFENVIKILKSVECNIKKITVDGYRAYDRGLKELKDDCGTAIDITRCYTHARRQVHDYLKQSGLLKVYREVLIPKNSLFTDFEKNLIKYKQAELEKIKDREFTQGQIKLLELKCNMLTIYYLINLLFVVDSQVVDKYSFHCNSEQFIEELNSVRLQYSSKIVSALFDCIYSTIAANPEIVEISNSKSTGEERFKANNVRLEGKALLYLLSYEKDLKQFISDPTVELSQSAAERAIRSVVCCKQNGFEFIDSVDGAHAFSDFMTITNTCMLNKVPVKEYMLWLVANIKFRLKKYAESHIDDTMYKLPRKQDLVTGEKDSKGENIKIRIDMYDKRNIICYDKINLDGLAPYDYRQLLLNPVKA